MALKPLLFKWRWPTASELDMPGVTEATLVVTASRPLWDFCVPWSVVWCSREVICREPHYDKFNRQAVEALLNVADVLAIGFNQPDQAFVTFKHVNHLERLEKRGLFEMTAAKAEAFRLERLQNLLPVDYSNSWPY